MALSQERCDCMGAGALAAGVFGGAVFLLAGRKFSRESCQRGRFALWASLLFLGAFVFRVVLGYYSQGFTTDTDTFKSWANIANTVGFQQIYHEDIFLDYPPGYLYVLVFLEKLRLLLGLPLESQGYTGSEYFVTSPSCSIAWRPISPLTITFQSSSATSAPIAQERTR